MGWSTRDYHRDFVMWRPRELNKLADFYANKSMNLKYTWRDTYDSAYVNRSISFHAFSDGGKRDEGHAAAAWVIFAVANGNCKEIGNGAISLTNKDSFQTETLAMEYAILHIHFIIKERSKTSHTGLQSLHPPGL